MTCLIFDPFMGASGDMIIASLIDLGANSARIREIMESVAPVTVDIGRTTKNGISATRVRVSETTDKSETSTYPAIASDIRSSGLPDPIVRDALAIFSRIASAESRVHGVSEDELHLHELGQADAIADVVGASTAIHDLAPSRVFCARIVAGRGFVDTAHGRCPVPAPATLGILAGSVLSWEYGSIEHELLTPTGAAILAHLVGQAEPGGSGGNSGSSSTGGGGSGGGCVATGIGYGAGKADLEIPNVLRVIRCEDERRGQELGKGHVQGHVPGSGAGADIWRGGDASFWRDTVEVLETSVDDVTGEVLGNLIDELMAFGAHDAIIIPATMKKGRSGHLIQVIVKPGDAARIAQRIIKETGSLGVRISPTKHRLIAKRKMESVRIEIDGTEWDAAVKIATDEGGCIFSISAEFEDAKTIAQETGVPVREVMRRIVDLAWITLV
ncbi:MAG: nickel pincer cofactor biosynthesis protein LarC [Candidatus Methanogaster sp.]|uniref:Nickel pincer cofactor biosynthesis protein LarC n=1 Tax=Candidatus Methanogaster sp. TaxID=3386292 RepID=A0AC61L585_9EURY|nr:MAG: nickel pincer cofactor biosynthesis protein LarC [ANME-2 cluster archaeon]